MIEKTKTTRESNIELLRIIAMFIIIIYHYLFYAEFKFNESAMTLNHCFYTFIMIGGKLGVNVFVLISGYFLINNKEMKLSLNHIFKFLFQIVFYSITLSVILMLMKGNTFNLEIIKEIINKKWWFADTYFLLYLIHPLINKVLINLSKKNYQLLLLILIFIFSFIPMFFYNRIIRNDLLWFIVLYCIAGYIKIFGINKKYTYKHYVSFFLITLFFTYGLCISLYISTKLYGNTSIAFLLYKQNMIFILMLAVFLFMIFKELKIKTNKWINLIASTTFGVYLIHEDNITKYILFEVLALNIKYQNSILFIPHCIIISIIIYIICIIIELLRKKLVERPLFNMLKINKNDKFSEISK